MDDQEIGFPETRLGRAVDRVLHWWHVRKIPKPSRLTRLRNVIRDEIDELAYELFKKW